MVVGDDQGPRLGHLEAHVQHVRVVDERLAVDVEVRLRQNLVDALRQRRQRAIKEAAFPISYELLESMDTTGITFRKLCVPSPELKRAVPAVGIT